MSTDIETLRIGLQNLRRNLRRSLLTGSMVALGVAALIFFRGYISSLHHMMIEMVINALAAPMQVERTAASASLGVPSLDLDLPESLGQSLRGVPGVTGVAPRIRFGAFLINGDKSSLVVVLGVDPEGERGVSPHGPGAGYHPGPGAKGLEGEGPRSIDDDTLVVGVGVARSLGLSLGDRVSLLARTQKGSTDAADGVVRGTFFAGDPELDKRMVVMSLRRAQKLLHMPGRVMSFGLAGTSIEQLPTLTAGVRSAVEGQGLTVRSWEQLAPYYRDVIALQNDIMAIVMGMVFALVLAGIVNTMLMSVFERQREVGTLMALGFRRRTIVLLFVVEACGLGGIAAFLGVMVGGVVVAITHYTGIPFEIPAVGTIIARPLLDVRALLVTIAVAVGTALVAGLYPAYRASRLTPVEALRAV